MLFEDLHWADAGPLDFIDHLLGLDARPAHPDRHPGPAGAPRAAPRLGRGQAHFTPSSWSRCRPPRCATCSPAWCPACPTGRAGHRGARRRHPALCRGDRALAARGRSTAHDAGLRAGRRPDDLAVPETLTALIAARLDALDPVDRRCSRTRPCWARASRPRGSRRWRSARADLEPRLRRPRPARAVRLEVDPRSPERGQYAFVQALIREVAYNTSRRRTARPHLAAARYFETMGTDELAGALARHYLAAQRLAAEGAEADALAAQARIALKAAAERSIALGAHEQAVALLEQALEVTTDPADRAALHTAPSPPHDGPRRSRRAAPRGGCRRDASHGRSRGDRHRNGRPREDTPRRTVGPGARTLDRGGGVGGVHGSRADACGSRADGARALAGTEAPSTPGALVWMDRLLPIAERLSLLEDTISGLIRRGTTLLTLGRPREGMIVMRGVHQLAIANDVRDLELNARVLMTFFEQWGEPAAGVALGREGLEIGRRLGSRSYGFQMVGNTSIWTARSCARCAARTGHRISRRPTGCSGSEPSRTPSSSRTCSWRVPGLPSPPAVTRTCARSARQPSTSPATSRR